MSTLLTIEGTITNVTKWTGGKSTRYTARVNQERHGKKGTYNKPFLLTTFSETFYTHLLAAQDNKVKVAVDLMLDSYQYMAGNDDQLVNQLLVQKVRRANK